MRRAYLLIDTAGAYTWKVVSSLRDKPGVIAVDAVTGAHSVIAVLEETDARTIANMTLEDIRAIEGVRYITTCFAIRARS